jgi:hypothetical protein
LNRILEVAEKQDEAQNRYFEKGAYRDTDRGKNEYTKFLHPLVVEAYGDYMTKHRVQSDGVVRAADNWRTGFGDDHKRVCLESAFRHLLDVWKELEGYESRDGIDEALGGLFFNTLALWAKVLEERV